ncbi:hypothetical protein Leryth_016985 [Lithospermum erythrorhizon]|nr:hypothetical protein Leryth_016985 [Lithospermum erythrorhizon]
MVEEIVGHSDNAIDSCYVDDNQASRVVILGERDTILADEFPDEMDEEEKLSSSMVAMAEPSQFSSSSCGDKDTVKLFEQALIKEQAARKSLYIELEKERSAAASAANEAMAMILRLQEEKATVEMEARQYQRIIEEKFSYDAEEMDILKDILLIREMEKHSLEKEVEDYRQMLNLSNEQFQEDEVEFEKKHLNLLVDPRKDPVFNIDELTASSIDEKTSLKDMQSPCSRNGEQNVQEKEMIPISGHLSVPPQQDERRFLQDKMDFYGTRDAHIPGRENLEKLNVRAFDEVKKSVVVMSNKEPQVHDIHVIVDEPGLPDEHERMQSNISMVNDMSKTISEIDRQPTTSSRLSIGVIGDCGSSSNLHGGTESTFDILSRLPPVGPQQNSIPYGQQRNPMSSINNERFKIDREIGWLQDRLKVIQVGREKLNLIKEPQDRENIQLKLLEDIACQLQAIRLLTESGKAVRQASLPPPSTKVTSKKRRSRSASSGVHKGS